VTQTAEGSTATSPTPVIAKTAHTSKRDPFFDNAKFLLIMLVVIGHNWVPALDNFHTVKAAYIFVYAFHIPAFVLLSGYFSRSFEGRPKQWRKLLLTVFLPYLIFQTAYAAVTAYTTDKPFNLNFASPIYVCWFLLALFVWRAATPLLRSVPHVVPLAIAVSLLAGITVSDTHFALGRVLQLLPWFVIGLKLRPQHFQLLRKTWIRITSTVVLVLALASAYLCAPWVNVRWLDRQLGFKALGVSPIEDLLYALALDIITAVLVIAVLAVIPCRASLLSRLGVFTMYPFLLHGLVVRLLQHYGLHGYLLDRGLLGALTVTLGAIALAFLLTTPPVRVATSWAVEPSKLIKRLRPHAATPTP
jgi:fucose 4-O-acetylase-like acetyltransferase